MTPIPKSPPSRPVGLPLATVDTEKTPAVVVARPSTRVAPKDTHAGTGTTSAKDIVGLPSATPKAGTLTTIAKSAADIDSVLGEVPSDADLLSETAQKYLCWLPRSAAPLLIAESLGQLRTSPKDAVGAQAILDRVVTPKLDVPLRKLEVALRQDGQDLSHVRALPRFAKDNGIWARMK